MTLPEWTSVFDEYTISYPFGDSLKAIRIREDDVDNQLLEECVEDLLVSEVAKGYYITHEDIEDHLKVINEHGIEPYLKKRLEMVADE